MTGAAGDPPEAVIERGAGDPRAHRRPGGRQRDPRGPAARGRARRSSSTASTCSPPAGASRTPWVELAQASGRRCSIGARSPAEAAGAADAGVDVVIAQGSDAGGHTGRVPTFALVPQVVDAAGGVPVLAAGGIADGRGLVAALALGADGVLIGTRLVAAEESGAHEEYKRRVVAADATEIGPDGRLRDRLAGPAGAGAAQRDDRRVGGGTRAARPALRPAGRGHRGAAARGRRAGDPALVGRHPACRRPRRGGRDGPLRRPCRGSRTGDPPRRRDRAPHRRRGGGGLGGHAGVRARGRGRARVARGAR